MQLQKLRLLYKDVGSWKVRPVVNIQSRAWSALLSCNGWLRRPTRTGFTKSMIQPTTKIVQRARQLELRRILFVFAPAAPLTHSKNLYYFHIPYPSAPVTAEPLPPTPLPPFAASDFGYTLDIYFAKVDKSVRIWCGRAARKGRAARHPRPTSFSMTLVCRGLTNAAFVEYLGGRG